MVDLLTALPGGIDQIPHEYPEAHEGRHADQVLKGGEQRHIDGVDGERRQDTFDDVLGHALPDPDVAFRVVVLHDLVHFLLGDRVELAPFDLGFQFRLVLHAGFAFVERHGAAPPLQKFVGTLKSTAGAAAALRGERSSSCWFTLFYGRVHYAPVSTVMPFSAKYLAAPGWKGMAMPSVAKARSSSAPLAWAAVISSLFSKMVFTMA